MKKYEKVYSYLDYFERLSKETLSSTEEKLPFVKEWNPQYVTYTREMINFAKSVYEGDLIDYTYTETLKEYKIEDIVDMEKHIPSADERLTKAILTKMIRDERFSSGAWITYIEKGMFIKILRRIGELYGYSK